MASTIQVRVEDDLKLKADELFKKLGTDTTSAIRMFLTQAILNEGFPFEIKISRGMSSPYRPLTENEMIEKLERGRNGKSKDADVVVSEMRSKYGL